MGAFGSTEGGSKTEWHHPASIYDFRQRRQKQLEDVHKTNRLWENNKQKKNVIDKMFEEDVLLMGSLKSVDDIDKFILRFYDLKEETETTKQKRQLSGFGANVADWDVMISSGKNYDCLIHSFLTALCSNFRRLEETNKNEFANFFRRVVFFTLPVFQCLARYDENQAKRIQKELLEMSFLDDSVIFILNATFKCNTLLAREDFWLGNQFQMVDSEMLKKMIPKECYPSVSGKWETICLYTSGQHFESIRKPNGSYTFTDKDVTDAIAGAEIAKNAKNALGEWICPTCTFLNPALKKKCEQCETLRPMNKGKPDPAGGQNARLAAAKPDPAGGQNAELVAAIAASLKPNSKNNKAILAAILAKIEKGHNITAEEMKLLDFQGGGKQTRYKRKYKRRRTRRT